MRLLYMTLLMAFMYVATFAANESNNENALWCDLNCKTYTVPVSLLDNCERTLWPEDVLNAPDPGCSYTINVYSTAGWPIGPTVNGSHIGQTLDVKVSANGNSCWARITVVDQTAPVAICDANTNVTLGSDGIARVYATTFDDGSYDNCGIQSIQIRRMTQGWCPPGTADDTQFRDYVEFCCEDATGTGWVEVELMVTDYAGNIGKCWAQVYIADYSEPSIVCPPDITINCDYPYNLNNLDEFGTVQMFQSDVEAIYINDPHYPSGIAGYDGYITAGGCNGGSTANLWVVESSAADVSCNSGIIYRTFTIENTNVRCTQKIFINPLGNNGNYIDWPDDVSLGCGADSSSTDPSQTGIPEYENGECSMLMHGHQDEVFVVVPGSCYKILRKWIVIDWCTHKPNSGSNKGRWEHTQVIKVGNSEAPTITACDDVTVCPTEQQGCDGYVELNGSATDDCTPVNHLKWHYCIDLYNDQQGIYQGEYDINGYTSSASGFYPQGTHRLVWRVDDQCGNFEQCSMLFTVKDCKKPSPICHNGLSTVIMPSAGMISLDAAMFNASSFDNCTPENKLRYSWSTDPNDTHKVFDCNNIGTNEVEIFVHDLDGNYQYCTTYLILEDNMGICPDSAQIVVAGMVRNADDLPMGMARVKVLDKDITFNNLALCDDNGAFSFGSFSNVSPRFLDLQVKVDDDVRNGMNVLDVLLMQKHITGLQTIDDPLLQIAADPNNDGEVDINDVNNMISVLLEYKNGFGSRDPWVFVDDAMNYVSTDYKTIRINSSTSNPLENLLIRGVKLGDVNNSVRLDGLKDELDDRTKIGLAMYDHLMQANSPTTIELSFDGIESFSAYYLEMIVDPRKASVESIVDQEGNPIAFNSTEKGEVKIIYSDAMLVQEAAAYKIRVTLTANLEIWASDLIQLSSASQLVDVNQEELGLSLELKERKESVKVSVPLQISASPNPFYGSSQIQLSKEVDENYGNMQVQVFDHTGAVVLQKQIPANTQTFELNANDLSGVGMYWLKITDRNQSSTIKLLYIK